MARRTGDAVEVVFGAKQLFLAFSVAAFTLAGTFLVGVETGHKRAQRGVSSPLAFLERKADDHTGQVPIPDVLLKEEELERAKSRAIERAAQAAIERQKPRPVVSAAESGQSAPDPQADAQPPQVQPSPAQPPPVQPPAMSASEAGRIQIQVAALKNRSNAEGLVEWLRNQGFQAHVDADGTDGFLRVYVGPFEEAESAAAVQQRLEQEGFKPMIRRF